MSVDPYDVEGYRVWDAEEVAPLSNCRVPTEEQRQRANQPVLQIEPVPPANWFDLLEVEYEGR